MEVPPRQLHRLTRVASFDGSCGNVGLELLFGQAHVNPISSSHPDRNPVIFSVRHQFQVRWFASRPLCRPCDERGASDEFVYVHFGTNDGHHVYFGHACSAHRSAPAILFEAFNVSLWNVALPAGRLVHCTTYGGQLGEFWLRCVAHSSIRENCGDHHVRVVPLALLVRGFPGCSKYPGSDRGKQNGDVAERRLFSIFARESLGAPGARNAWFLACSRVPSFKKERVGRKQNVSELHEKR